MKSPAFWWQPHLTLPAALLWPLAAVYGAVAARHGAWRARRAYYAAVPVISVGNLTIGGSGKTPLVQALAQHYAAQGLQVAVVLRGYGGREAHDPLHVTFQHTATQVGDEAAALFCALPRGVQVWVGRHRPSVVRRAEAAGAGLIILDDGFQRRDVARNADLLVLNGHPPAGQRQPQPFGNGLCVPAGPLREPLAGRFRASWAVVLNEPPAPPGQALPYYGLVAYRLQVAATPASLVPLRSQPVVAFAGLGHPEKFFSGLRQAGVTLATTVALPDHVRYRPAQLAALQREARAQGAVLATTSKDAAKLPPGFAHVVATTVTGSDWPSLLAGLAVKIGR
jgi:tetraacyldisaccharide 4'-kinase